MDPIDYQSRGGAFERNETMNAGVYLARRKLVTWLDLYHWKWTQEYKRLKLEIARLEVRFKSHAQKAKHTKQRRRLEIRIARLRAPLQTELAGHMSSPRIGILGDHADAGHRFMADYQMATSALAGRSIWIGDRVGGGGGGGRDSAIIIAAKVSDVIACIERVHGKPAAKVVLAVCGDNASITKAAKESGLTDRRGKAMQELRVGLGFLCQWYAPKYISQPFRRSTLTR